MLHAELLEIINVALDAGLAQRRLALIQTLPIRIRDQLPTGSSPQDQMMVDLGMLNELGVLSDGTSPLAQWLEMAATLTTLRPQSAIFRRALGILRAKGAISAPCPSSPPRYLADVLLGDWSVEVGTGHRRLPLLHISIQRNNQLRAHFPKSGVSAASSSGSWRMLDNDQLEINIPGRDGVAFTTVVTFATILGDYLEGHSAMGEDLFWSRQPQ